MVVVCVDSTTHTFTVDDYYSLVFLKLFLFTVNEWSPPQIRIRNPSYFWWTLQIFEQFL